MSDQFVHLHLHSQYSLLDGAIKFDELFDFQSIPKNIRKLVDDETLGISRSERTGMDILTGNNPKIGVFLDSEKETIRIKKNN